MSLVAFSTTDPDPPRRRMTVREFLGMAEDGVDRMLLDGEVWEVGLMIKNPLHGQIAARLGYLLEDWLRRRPAPRGSLHVGNTGFQLDEGSVVGVDIAYASPEVVARTPPDVEIFAGPPALAVEVLALGTGTAHWSPGFASTSRSARSPGKWTRTDKSSASTARACRSSRSTPPGNSSATRTCPGSGSRWRGCSTHDRARAEVSSRGRAGSARRPGRGRRGRRAGGRP